MVPVQDTEAEPKCPHLAIEQEIRQPLKGARLTGCLWHLYNLRNQTLLASCSRQGVTFHFLKHRVQRSYHDNNPSVTGGRKADRQDVTTSAFPKLERIFLVIIKIVFMIFLENF